MKRTFSPSKISYGRFYSWQIAGLLGSAARQNILLCPPLLAYPNNNIHPMQIWKQEKYGPSISTMRLIVAPGRRTGSLL